MKKLLLSVVLLGSSAAMADGLTYSPLASEPASFDFGRINPPAVAFKVLTLTNRGRRDISIQSIWRRVPAIFEVTATTCPLGNRRLISGETCTINVRYMPTSIDMSFENIFVSYFFQGGSGTLAIPLSGNARF
jgi:hypothetical protein